MTFERCTSLLLLSLAIVELPQLLGCQFPYAETTLVGPTIELDAAQPSASFEVTLCVETDKKIDHVYPRASVEAVATPSTDRALTLNGFVPEAFTDLEVTHLGYASSTGVVGESTLDPFDLIADGEPWEKRKGRRCAAPQTVVFEVEGLEEGESVTLAWILRFGAEYDDRTPPEEDDFSIQVVPL